MTGFKGLSAVIACMFVTAPGLAETVDLAAVKASVEKYKDVNVALADGYIPDPGGHCVTAAAEGLPAEWGGMGMHYLHPGLLKIAAPGERVDGASTHTDWTQPAILLYEPQADGSMELVGVENLVWQAAWMAAGNEGPPEINGRLWDAMADDPATEADEAHGFTPHFDQHIWLFRDNPSGELMPFNPNVTCDFMTAMHHEGGK